MPFLKPEEELDGDAWFLLNACLSVLDAWMEQIVSGFLVSMVPIEPTPMRSDDNATLSMRYNINSEISTSTVPRA